MNKSGKTLTIFMVVIALLLTSVTAISVFFFIKEMELRESAEAAAEQLRLVEARLQGEIREANRKIFRFEEQLRDTEERLESMTEEVDFQEELREQARAENRDLRASLTKAEELATGLRSQLDGLRAQMDQKIAMMQEELKLSVDRNKTLDEGRARLQDMVDQMRKRMEEEGIVDYNFDMSVILPQEAEAILEAEADGLRDEVMAEIPEAEAVPLVGLERIIILANPEQTNEGKVISVDREAEFLIINLGESHGLREGSELMVYRGESQIGDIKVSRVLAEMAAADLIPPLKSHDVRKDDRVIIKEQ